MQLISYSSYFPPYDMHPEASIDRPLSPRPFEDDSTNLYSNGEKILYNFSKLKNTHQEEFEFTIKDAEKRVHQLSLQIQTLIKSHETFKERHANDQIEAELLHPSATLPDNMALRNRVISYLENKGSLCAINSLIHLLHLAAAKLTAFDAHKEKQIAAKKALPTVKSLPALKGENRPLNPSEDPYVAQMEELTIKHQQEIKNFKKSIQKHTFGPLLDSLKLASIAAKEFINISRVDIELEDHPLKEIFCVARLKKFEQLDREIDAYFHEATKLVSYSKFVGGRADYEKRSN